MITPTLISFALLISSISTTPGAAAPSRGQVQRSGKTIAIIAGHNKNMTLHVADVLTETFARQSSMQVLSSDRIRLKAPVYPTNIAGPFVPQYFGATVDHKRTDVRTVRRIKDQLGVDYLYVVWLLESRVNMTNMATTRFITQLFAGPAGALAYNGEIESVTGGTLTCWLSVKAASAEKKHQDLVEECEKHVRQVLVEIEKIK